MRTKIRPLWFVILGTMRFVLPLCFALLTLALARAEDLPVDAHGFRQYPGETRLPADGYRFTLLRTEPDKNHGRIGLFHFRHTFDNPIRLWGFGFQKDGSLRVRFERFAKLQAGEWKEIAVGYCGTGAETFELVPDRDYILQVPLWPFAKDGVRGVLSLSGQPAGMVISDEFDGATVRSPAR